MQAATSSLPLSFFEECSQHLMLMRGGLGSLAVDCPVRIFHGMQDRIVPASVSRRLMDCLKTEDVHVSLIKVSHATSMQYSTTSFAFPACLASASMHSILKEQCPFPIVLCLTQRPVFVITLYMQDGNHRLSRAQDLSAIMATVAEMEDY